MTLGGVTSAQALDTDGDGIADSLEAAVPLSDQTNLYLPDSDGDGLGDGTEDANQDGTPGPGETHGRNRDSDGDQYLDGFEVKIAGSDPLDPASPMTPWADMDGDELPAQLDSDDGNPDVDGDRYADGYEAVILNLAAVNDPWAKPSLSNVNGDSMVDSADGALILNFFADDSNPEFLAQDADIDRNGLIDNVDATMNLNYFGHTRPNFPASRSADRPPPSSTGVEIAVSVRDTDMNPIDIVTDANDPSLFDLDFLVAIESADMTEVMGYALRIRYDSGLVRYRPTVFQNGLSPQIGKTPGYQAVRDTDHDNGPGSSVEVVTTNIAGYSGPETLVYLGFDVIGPPGSRVEITVMDDPRSTGPYHNTLGENILHTSPGTSAVVYIDHVTFTPTPTPLPDLDGDGVPDALETRCPASGQTNLYLPDSDGDGLADGLEDSNRNGDWDEGSETSARRLDTDGDQYQDGIEAIFLSSDALDPASPVNPFVDSDGDGLPDSLDPNSSDKDNDGDRFLDSFDALWFQELAAAETDTQVPLLGNALRHPTDPPNVVDGGDAQMVLNFFGRLPVIHFYPEVADVNRDAYIDNADCQLVLVYFARLIPYLPAEISRGR